MAKPKYSKIARENLRRVYGNLNLDSLHATFRMAGLPSPLPTKEDLEEPKIVERKSRAIPQNPDAEKRFTIPELAAEWTMSENKVRSLVLHEPGVIEIVGPKRTRRWIPLSVALRVNKRLSSDGLKATRASSSPPAIMRKRNSRTAVVEQIGKVVDRRSGQ